MLNVMTKIVSELNTNSISWLVWKGGYHYIDGFEGDGDIDILLNENDGEQGKKILEKNGFVCFRTQIYSYKKGVEDWIGFDDNSGKLIHIHLHFIMPFGDQLLKQYSFNLKEECLNNRTMVGDNIYIQNPVLEYLLFLCMLSTNCVSEKKQTLYRRYFLDTIKVRDLELFVPSSISEDLYNFIICQEKELKKANAIRFIKSLYSRNIKFTTLQGVSRRIIRIIGVHNIKLYD